MENRYENFKNELLLEAESSGVLQAEAFFQLFAAAAIDNGDIEHIDHCPVRHEGARKFRIDGYSLNREQGELILVICDHRSTANMETLNSSDVEGLFHQVDRFFEKSKNVSFIEQLEDTSPTFMAAFTIYEFRATIKRVRILLFSNARMSVRKKLVTMREDGGVRFSYSILDFERYNAILDSRTGSDPIEIDFSENGLSPLPCLRASSSSDEYESFLVIIPGNVLAEIYGLYGARLLEANVRTFLQARTKVNKGIINTLKDLPGNFFAFNNGLTATASKISLAEDKNGLFIQSANNLQIVNGGQTTASILYARDKGNADLSNVYVQMKLSVIEPEAIEKIVPLISRYANTQNRISEADFFASHSFHLQMEKMSRRISAPPKEGELVATKWFYERARGQYNDEQAYMATAARKRFLAEHPRDQKIEKIHIAKYEMSFLCHPHIVSLGAQKCFMEFAKQIDGKWDSEASNFGDGYFRDAMVRALIFRWTDKMIGTSEWYKNDRSHKAFVVTYTIATLILLLQREKCTLNFKSIWAKQQVPEELQDILRELAPEVAKIIKDPPPNVRDIREYCKKQACWARVSTSFDTTLSRRLQDCIVSSDQAKQTKKNDKKIRKIDSGIETQARVVELKDKWHEIMLFGQRKRLFTPIEMSVLIIAAKIPSQIPTEKQSAIALGALQKAIDEGLVL